MWRAVVVLYQLLALVRPQWAQDDVSTTAQNCSLDCVRQGGPGCQYCRISSGDVKNSIKAFGSCIPWPCFELVGKEDPQICQHYVHAPNDVEVEFVDEPNPDSDTIVVSWKPSYFGIAFLRGFQVSLQALGGTGVACQLFLFNRNLTLPPSHAHRVYKSDPFPGLPLGSQYAVTVMALPVPEEWEKFYRSRIFSTRTCAEKNSLEQCKTDWYPKNVTVEQKGTNVTVTFNLAPANLGIRRYFSLCYANSRKMYKGITPNFTKNKTHHSYQLHGLQEGINYTCEIAADEMDAVRKKFKVYVTHTQKDVSFTPSVDLILPLSLTVAVLLSAFLAAITKKTSTLRMIKLDIKPDIIKQNKETQEELVAPDKSSFTPPRLLICYSSCDGPAHVNAVMQLGAFIQQYMATQVCLDLWDFLSVAEEGSMAWYCRQLRECDFVLVICSRGLKHRSEPLEPQGDDEDEQAAREQNLDTSVLSSNAAVELIGAEVGRAKARGHDLSKYMAAIFEYSQETDIPIELRLVPHYVLTSDLPLLFSHLHGVPLHRPGGFLKINHITEEGFTKLPAGAALQGSIQEARMAMQANISVKGGN
ncbi:interleukin-17 receptor D [Betta splendens]|uniref:Interleukin-17 receptor D n=1 Tax=Betta splendens TaxID=158456 RepID=A0A6P7N1F6_BETSP|nr:interleukin-17 receptor D [Betta splendens]